MKITLFGATGKTGRYLIDEGLKRGMDMTVFARTNSPFENANVRVVRGELTDRVSLREAISGSDAVLSALGPTSLKHPKNLPITTAMGAITSVMKQEGVKRLIAVSTGTAPDPEDRFDPKIRYPALLIRFLMPRSFQDIIGLANAIRASELDWTMVRVAFLKSSPASNRLHVGLYGRSTHTLTVSRQDVAIFMFDQLSSTEFVNQAPGISSR
ncbi:NAD(P)-dependent oxidoreductase [Dickeya fangzhongdai]|uniref:NAD(P)-dependent oxidoreductase n=1 Tax=Dickeya fangzhongdai TaxID=1778540 RepID=UPI000EB557A5|nr:NAD(P)H-binding protein [Dickeya fangzhongdai]AYH47119.1 flavin reductase [Dickeya fangzhongdai]MBO8132597.1 NAD(P)H-binding protein [Dickeya fangzhongdai]